MTLRLRTPGTTDELELVDEVEVLELIELLTKLTGEDTLVLELILSALVLLIDGWFDWYPSTKAVIKLAVIIMIKRVLR